MRQVAYPHERSYGLARCWLLHHIENRLRETLSVSRVAQSLAASRPRRRIRNRERIFSNQVRGCGPLWGSNHFPHSRSSKAPPAEVSNGGPLSRFSGALTCSRTGSLVVLYNENLRDGSFSVDDRAAVANMELLCDYSDGRIFMATAQDGIICSVG